MAGISRKAAVIGETLPGKCRPVGAGLISIGETKQTLPAAWLDEPQPQAPFQAVVIMVVNDQIVEVAQIGLCEFTRKDIPTDNGRSRLPEKALMNLIKDGRMVECHLGRLCQLEPIGAGGVIAPLGFKGISLQKGSENERDVAAARVASYFAGAE